MLVQCVYDNIHQLARFTHVYQELKRGVRTHGGAVSLTIGNAYVVYCIRVHRGITSYFVSDEDLLRYPFPHPAQFFKILDGRVSRYWVFERSESESVEGMAEAQEITITFREWAKDGLFFEKLVNGDEPELSLFHQYKCSMDLEFPHPAISIAASVLQDRWVTCPKCGEAWENQSEDALMKCVVCSTVVQNPNFVDRSR